MLVINLNAPPQAGKDTLCQLLKEKINNPRFTVVHMEFKSMLFDVAIRAAGLTPKLWFALYEREYKERKCPYLLVNGEQVSPRDWMIHCSENIMKPTIGKDVFGQAFANSLQELQKNSAPGEELVVVVSDGGFIEESIPVVNLVDPDNYFLVRIHRRKEDGSEYNFDGDSRRYLYAKEFPQNLRPFETDIMNEEGDAEGTVQKICDFVEDVYGESLIAKI